MEDDDDFGDLYTDVLRPLTTSFQSESDAPASRPIDPNVDGDDEDADLKKSFSNPSSARLDSSIREPRALPEIGGFDSNSKSEAPRIVGVDGLESEERVSEKGEGVKLPEKGGLDFMEEDDDLDIVVEERENKDDDLVMKDANFIDKQENTAENKENTVNYTGADAVGDGDMIPGLSGKLENREGSNFEDEWESDDSEDDLQIVLNDSNHGPMGMEMMPGMDDEDDEPLVIVADNGDVGHHQPMLEDQEWVGEDGGERRELGDAAKATTPALPPKVGYSNHMYHHPFHSQFKYVRPGAAPIPGAVPVTPGGIQGQVRPPVTMGRGRGDWRPGGIKGPVSTQKGLHPGYGMPVWGPNAAGRGYGTGLDFTLPSHKTIFEVDIDGFEEKPWRLPGIDVSDFFNFGLNEESWKDYCKQLEQLRLETTMQSKIRVYESGRVEQDYDPDLPPELAAAVGNQDISSENANHGKADAVPIDLARANERGRPSVPIGRPIPVEIGSGDRPPSIETRRPRMHDSDAVIEIVCQRSNDDDVAEQQDNNMDGEDLEGVDDIDDPQRDDSQRIDRFAHSNNGPNRENVARRAHIVSRDEIEREDDASEVPVRYHPDSEISAPHEERSTRGRGHVKSSKMNACDNKGEKQTMDDQSESFDSEDGKKNRPLSSSREIESDGEQAVAVGNDVNNEFVMDDRSFDMEREEIAVDATTSDALEDEKLMRRKNKRIRSPHDEHLSQENEEGEDSKATRSSENSKARSGSSKDHGKLHGRFEDEVVQGRHHPRAGSVKRPLGDDDNARRKSRHQERENSRSRRGGSPSNSLLHRHMKSENADWRKESDISDGRRIRVEDTRKREHGGEIGSRYRGKVRESERSERAEHHQSRNQLETGNWRGQIYDQDTGSRQRDRDDNLKTRIAKLDDPHYKRRKEGTYISRENDEKDEITYNHRESSSRRKRERDDVSDQRKRDDHAKLKDDDMHYDRQKEEGSLHKERGERQRDRDEWHRPKRSHEEILSRKEREESRSVMRSGRPAEDKTWVSHSRGKDDYKGSGREYHLKNVERHSDQLKRRDRVEHDSFSKHRRHEDAFAHGNQGSNDEKRATYERPGTSDEHVVYGSDTLRRRAHRHKEGTRKDKAFESGEHSPLMSSKSNHDERIGQISETVNMRARTEQANAENDYIHANRQSSRKHGEEAFSDDDDEKRGRSKLERWTSHQERDFNITSISSSSSSLKKNQNPDTYSSVGRLPEEPWRKVEGNKPEPRVHDDKDTTIGETNNANAKVMEDTVEKLKKRSERFKLPMPSEKEAMTVKKIESEALPCAQTEIRIDSEIKPERPPRKRRWTSN